MLKRTKNILLAVTVVMLFTAQVQRPNEKGPQHGTVAKTAVKTVTKTVAAGNKFQSKPRVVNRAAPPVIRHEPQPVQNRPVVRQPQESRGPRVYAVPQAAPVANNRLLNRQHHNHWQPRYNFYDNQYHFYPYVNIASVVELSAACVSAMLGGQTFYYDQGTFYQQDDQAQYYAVSPPVGIIINALPVNARQIEFNGQVYYRYKGIFYLQVDGGYQVVGPVEPDPNGS